MDEFITHLRALSQSKRLVPAEQVIMTEIEKLDEYLVEKVDEEALEQFEKILFALFDINDGRISIPCSISIAEKLLRVYSFMKSPQVYEVISRAIESGTASVILGAGYICRRIGDRWKSQLPRFVDFLLGQKSHTFACVYALRACFKAGGKALSEMLNQAFEHVKKLLLHSTQASLVMELKFMKSIVWIPGAPVKGILEAAKTVYLAQKTPVVRNDIAVIVARCAFVPLHASLGKKARDLGEWALVKKESDGSEIAGPLGVLQEFRKILKQSLSHFLNLLSTTMIARNAVPLFDFVRENCPQLISQLAPLLPADSKYSLFDQICKEQISPMQLRLILDLSPDKHAIIDAASVALLLAVAPYPGARKVAVDFFAMAAKLYPQISLRYLRTSLVYIAQPPELNRPIDVEMRGNGAVAYTILKNVSRLEDAILPNKDIISQFIDQGFKDLSFSWRLAEVFNILSLVPNEFTQDQKISDAVIMAVTYLVNQEQNALWRRLLKTVLRFRAAHQDKAQENVLVVAAMSCQDTMRASELVSLADIVSEPSLAFEIGKKIVAACPKLKINQELVKRFVKKLLPSGNELLLRFEPPKEYDAELDGLIRKFPVVFSRCQTNDKSLLFQALVKLDSPIGYLIILAISDQVPSKLPKRLHEVLLPKLESTNVNILHIISEILANFVGQYPSALDGVFQFVDSHKAFAGCPFLLSAIFNKISADNRYVSRALVFIDGIMKHSSTVPFALYSMSSILSTHSMQLTDLGINLSEVSVLFQTLHSNIALQPIVLHLIVECFCTLIEINSQYLTTKPGSQLAQLVLLLIKSVKYTPISYAKICYFDVARSVIHFAHSLVQKISELEFPTGVGCAMPLLLDACETFSDFMRFGYVKLKAADMLKTALLILQKTNDTRAASFLESLVYAGGLQQWVRTVRRVLLGNSLLDDNVSAIEPNISVKLAVLHATMPLLEKLRKKEKFNTENLDDIIASVCHVLSTGEIEIQEAAFLILERAIKLFATMKSEDEGRLLELYDVQFVGAVKVGFELNLNISGDFLSAYLDFATQGDFNSVVISGYVSGLKECHQRNSAYFNILTRLCSACQGNPDDEIKDFLVQQTNVISDVITQSMKLRKDDWRERSHFRELYAKCYEDLVPSYIWLLTLQTTRLIHPNVLLSFFLLEIWSEKESWKVNGALNAIPLIFDYMEKEIDPVLIELVIRMSVRFKHDENLARIVKGCSKSATIQSTSRQFLLTLAMDGPFDAKTFAYLLYNDTQNDLGQYGIAVADHFVSHNAPLQLFQILFAHSPDVIGFTIERILDPVFAYPHKLELIRVGIRQFTGRGYLPTRNIARFLLKTVFEGGLLVIANVMLEKPEIGVTLLREHIAKAIFLLALNDDMNCRSLVQFLELTIETTKKESFSALYAKSLFYEALEIMQKFGREPQNGPIIVNACVHLVVSLKDILGCEMESFFSAMPESLRDDVCGVLRLQIGKANLRKNNANLRTFSLESRGRKSPGEWQDLTTGESDSD